MKKRNTVTVQLLLLLLILLSMIFTGCSEPSKEPPVISLVSAGESHSMVLRTDGVLLGFGDNSSSQLGKGGDVDAYAVPDKVSILHNGTIKDVSSGDKHTLVLMDDGSVFSFGSNEYGQLGRTISENDTFDNNPELVTGIDGTTQAIKAIAISAGGNHSLILMEGGRVMSFGLNGYGQLGRSIGADENEISTIFSNVPRQVDKIDGEISATKAIAISAGKDHSLILMADGRVMSFGLNDYDQLGRPIVAGESETPNFFRNVPDQVGNIDGDRPATKAIAISAGKDHSLILMEDGTVLSFGDNSSGQLGRTLGTGETKSNTPGKVVGIGNTSETKAKMISTYRSHSLVLMADGRVMSFGSNEYGQLGIPIEGYDGSRIAYVVQNGAADLIGAEAVSAGGSHSLIVMKDGSVLSFGRNNCGQLGIGSSDDLSAIPVIVEFDL